ncbi:MAG: isoprenylcysteine carboxylmethyltransferase family protein [Spirochaetia bacterium]|nr:isoprenylcysteine carboxylmethyltransferase family protein [Spirochaetota bacterium]MCX8097052.1 isoprenylcysteine carboxylmethyltransferase family protein [Spirochaetota bacterium]MDW8111753.1 isoprenylcysteine carboxylmethyltransferase family protein [Spirochaetia bacterium]
MDGILTIGRILFWLFVVLWWVLDIYVLFVKKNFYSKVLDRKSRLVVIFLILTGVILAIAPEDFRATWRSREFGLFQLIGTFVIMTGVLVRLSAIITLGKHFTPDIGVSNERKIVKKGLYKWIRHPSYTGEIIAFIGVGIVFQHIPSSIFIVLFPTIAFIYRAMVEEKALIKEFGDEYIQYMKETRMFI